MSVPSTRKVSAASCNSNSFTSSNARSTMKPSSISLHMASGRPLVVSGSPVLLSGRPRTWRGWTHRGALMGGTSRGTARHRKRVTEAPISAQHCALNSHAQSHIPAESGHRSMAESPERVVKWQICTVGVRPSTARARRRLVMLPTPSAGIRSLSRSPQTAPPSAWFLVLACCRGRCNSRAPLHLERRRTFRSLLALAPIRSSNSSHFECPSRTTAPCSRRQCSRSAA